MTKEEKYVFVQELTETLKKNPNFFVMDIGGFTVEKTNQFRAKCFESGLKAMTVKNKLLIKALDNLEGDFAELYPALKKESTLLLIQDNPNAPAKMLKAFREGGDKPTVKAAVVEQAVFVGDKTLETMEKLKSKAQLIGEIVGMLQSPIQNVLGGLKGGGHKIAGIVETLSKR